LKVRFAGFRTITRSVTPEAPLSTGPAIVKALEPLLTEVDPTPGVRLLGVSASHLVVPVEQLTLGLGGSEGSETPLEVERAWSPASAALDSIRERFGSDAIGPASSLGGRRARRQPGTSPWGPDPPEPSGESR
jgi:DNA polymerase-4